MNNANQRQLLHLTASLLLNLDTLSVEHLNIIQVYSSRIQCTSSSVNSRPRLKLRTIGTERPPFLNRREIKIHTRTSTQVFTLIPNFMKIRRVES